MMKELIVVTNRGFAKRTLIADYEDEVAGASELRPLHSPETGQRQCPG